MLISVTLGFMENIETALHISPDYFPDTFRNIFKSHIENIECYSMDGDASDRNYFRFKFNCEKKNISSVVLMQLANPPIQKDIPFVIILKYLAECCIKVPDLFFIDSDKGFIFLEDLGDSTFEEKLRKFTSDDQEKYYKKALDILIKMQVDCTRHLNKNVPAFHFAFDLKKLTWELEFMVTHFVEGLLKLTVTEKDRLILNEEFFKICSLLSKQKRYFCHRDYHSRNIMINKDQLALIDFQDAMMGPCQYDLASLLRDSYFKLNQGLLNRLLTYYIKKKEKEEQVSINREKFLKVFDWMSIQRNLKALGTFGYQIRIKGNEKYREAIPRTIEYIHSNVKKYSELQRLKKYLEVLYNFKKI